MHGVPTKNMVMNCKVNIVEISNGIISKYHSKLFQLLFLEQTTKQQLVSEHIPFYNLYKRNFSLVTKTRHDIYYDCSAIKLRRTVL